MSKNCSEDLDTTIVLLHPASAPTVTIQGDSIEFQQEADLILPNQKKLKNSLVGKLAQYSETQKDKKIQVLSALRIDPKTGDKFPANYVIRIDGPGITAADVNHYTGVVRQMLSTLSPQQTLGCVDQKLALEPTDLEIIKPLTQELAREFAGTNFSRGLTIKYGNSSLDTMTLQGVMPPLTIEHQAPEKIRGKAKPVGFDEEKHIAILNVIPATIEGKYLQKRNRIEVLCSSPDLLRTLASAYSKRSLLEFEALRQLDATNQKTILTLQSLQETALAPESFELQ